MSSGKETKSEKQSGKRKAEKDNNEAHPKQHKGEGKEITIDLTADDTAAAQGKGDTKEKLDSGKCEECGALVTWPADWGTSRMSMAEMKRYNQGDWCCLNDDCFDTVCKQCHPEPYDMCKKCTKQWLAEVKRFEEDSSAEPLAVGTCVECCLPCCQMPEDYCAKCKMPVCYLHMDAEDRNVCFNCEEVEDTSAQSSKAMQASAVPKCFCKQIRADGSHSRHCQTIVRELEQAGKP